MSNLMDLHNLVITECERRGLELIHLPEKLVRRSTDVIVSCPCTGQRNMSIRNFIVTYEKGGEAFCCKRKSKVGKNNPAFGKPTWNAGTVGVSKSYGFFGFKEEWSDREDYLYFIETIYGTYKIGRSFHGIKYRFTETVKELGEWKASHKEVFDCERYILNTYKQHQNKIDGIIGGSEHFTKELPIQEVIEYANQKLCSQF